MSARRRVRAPRAISPWPFAGMVGMVAVLFLYAFAGLVAPWYVVPPLLLVWLALFVLCLRWWTPHPNRLPVVAAFALALWFASVLVVAAR